MKLFLVSSVLFAALLVASGTAYGQRVAPGSNREGRILAAYEKITAEKTAEIALKAGEVDGSLKDVKDAVDRLIDVVKSDDQKLAAVAGSIGSGLKNDSALVTALQGLAEAAKGLEVASLPSGSGSNSSSVSDKYDELYNVLNTRLESIEKTLGYDDYPTTTVTP